MLFLIKKGIRSVICQAVYQYTKANKELGFKV